MKPSYAYIERRSGFFFFYRIFFIHTHFILLLQKKQRAGTSLVELFLSSFEGNTSLHIFFFCHFFHTRSLDGRKGGYHGSSSKAQEQDRTGRTERAQPWRGRWFTKGVLRTSTLSSSSSSSSSFGIEKAPSLSATFIPAYFHAYFSTSCAYAVPLYSNKSKLLQQHGLRVNGWTKRS